ncbi:T9SS type A sorting domain-containing protein [Hymenobacter sp. BT730]|uniref:T9SS type A sorting domain-containing protein n=1 Tax=Hymenobacter sp. BT730 TaxID=3063332 RepID=UPI0026DF9515|nr:T9SS type A sorting domain-containing protein [Hymenobacter sp. BT730]
MSSTSHTPFATAATVEDSYCRKNFPFKKPMGLPFLSLIFALLFASDAFAQAVPQASLPTCTKGSRTVTPKCTSQDLRVIDAYLTAPSCSCNEGDTTRATLNFRLFNKTGSTRTSFAYFAVLNQRDENGVLIKSDYVHGCTAPVAPGDTSIATFTDEPIKFVCGASLTLVNAYIAWTDASGGDTRQCPLTFCDISPKCGFPQTIAITPLLTASVDTTASCDNSSTGSITVTPSGGKSPYDIVITNSSNQEVANLPNTTGAQTADSLAAGTYNVSVTDDAGCTYTTTAVVGSKVCCVAPPKPIICQTPADLCGNGTISLTISNAVEGDWYYVVQGTDIDSLQAGSGGSLTFTGLTPGGGLRVYGVDVKNNTRCPGEEANCDNTTIGTCSADFSARSSSSAQTLAPTKQRSIRTEVYPNPTGRDATINFSVPKSGHVLVRVYNAIGEPVATLLDGEVKAGENRALIFRGDKLPSGTYYYKVTANGKTKTNRISLSK